jgi:hypothetical protein
MGIQEDTGEVHGWLSPLDLRFREVASSDERYLSRSTFKVLDQNPLLKYTPQSWPTFVDRSRIRELARVSTGLSELIRSLPARVFDRDPERIARFYGLDEPFARTLLEPPDGIAGALSRGDFIYGQNGFQCLELNITGNLSGWENGLLADMLLGIPPIARFVRESGAAISHRNTFRLMLAHALEEARRAGLIDAGKFNMLVGIQEADTVEDPQVSQFLNWQHQEMLQQYAPELKGTLSIRSYSELASRDGFLYDGPRRLHSVLEWHAESVGSTDAAVLQCFKSGSLHLYNGPASLILNDKRNLALLSEGVDSYLFSPEERRLIRDHLPWSRQVLPGKTLFEGAQTPIEDLLKLQRERFVLKKARSVGGVHVVIGRLSSAEDWEAAVAAALDGGDWIAQEHVESRPFLFQAGEQGCCPHDAIWGPFVFGARYAGVILKVQPKPLGGVVNLWRGATEGIVFEVDDGTPEVA